MSILVVGSVALDSIQTPFGKHEDLLGGSATYFSIAASLFNRVNIVAVVGEDFPKKYLDLFGRRGIGTEGLDVRKAGLTFRWKGRYRHNLNTAHTIYTRLNVFQTFKPEVPQSLRDSKFVFLANIDPDLQYNVLKQIYSPKLVACDSMNYWIEKKRASLRRLLNKIDILLLNDAEVRQFTGESNLMKAARAIVSRGPKALIIKKGEHGVLYFSKKSHFAAPAFLLETVCDPTGAGDTFAGGLVGYLSMAPRIDETNIRKGIIYGSILASFAVEDFGVKRLVALSIRDIRTRYRRFVTETRF